MSKQQSSYALLTCNHVYVFYVVPVFDQRRILLYTAPKPIPIALNLFRYGASPYARLKRVFRPMEILDFVAVGGSPYPENR